MSDRIERPRDEGVYSARIEKDKKEKGKFSGIPPSDEKKVLTATFFTLLKKVFDRFSPSKKIAGKVVDLHTIIEHLEQFRFLLTQLQKEDLSQSADFAEELSHKWSDLLEGLDIVQIMERKNLTSVAKFRETMDLIRNFPPDSDHHFGYYLLEQAGKDWLPFPFIGMLKSLHDEKKTLTDWILLMSEVIDGLKQGLPFHPS